MTLVTIDIMTFQPVWSLGSSLTVNGTIFDSDGIAEAELLLILEADESIVWSSEIPVSGDSLVSFFETVVIPADAVVGEYHFEMEATDGTGVEMHTGFHVEVE